MDAVIIADEMLVSCSDDVFVLFVLKFEKSVGSPVSGFRRWMSWVLGIFTNVRKISVFRIV